MYLPPTGRWLSEDPAGYVDGPNQYLYVRNSPVNFVDPSGLAATENFKFTYIDHWLPEPRPGGPRTVWFACTLKATYPTKGDKCGDPFIFRVDCGVRSAGNAAEPGLSEHFGMSLAGNTGDGWRYLLRNVLPAYTGPTPGGGASGIRAVWTLRAATQCGSCDNLKCKGNLEFYTELPSEPAGGFPAPPWPTAAQTNLRLRLGFEYEADATEILSSSLSDFAKRQSHNMTRRPPSHPDRQTPIAAVGEELPSLCIT